MHLGSMCHGQSKEPGPEVTVEGIESGIVSACACQSVSVYECETVRVCVCEL